jgi:hypothetical protein
MFREQFVSSLLLSLMIRQSPELMPALMRCKPEDYRR